PDPADVDEAFARPHARQQRAQLVALARPPADHDLLTATTFCLGPCLTASRAVRRIEALGDDTFERHSADRFEHRLSALLEMIDVHDVPVILGRGEQLCEPPLALE